MKAHERVEIRDYIELIRDAEYLLSLIQDDLEECRELLKKKEEPADPKLRRFMSELRERELQNLSKFMGFLQELENVASEKEISPEESN